MWITYSVLPSGLRTSLEKRSATVVLLCVQKRSRSAIQPLSFEKWCQNMGKSTPPEKNFFRKNDLIFTVGIELNITKDVHVLYWTFTDALETTRKCSSVCQFVPPFGLLAFFQWLKILMKCQLPFGYWGNEIKKRSDLTMGTSITKSKRAHTCLTSTTSRLGSLCSHTGQQQGGEVNRCSLLVLVTAEIANWLNWMGKNNPSLKLWVSNCTVL